MSKREQLKKELKEIIDGIQDNDSLEKLYQLISENVEIIPSKEDLEAIERGKEEIKKGEYRFI